MNPRISVQRRLSWPFVRYLSSSATKKYRSFVGANALRAAGFRFSKIMRHWEGFAIYEAADRLAAAHGGTVRRVGGDGAGDTPDDISSVGATADNTGASARAAE